MHFPQILYESLRDHFLTFHSSLKTLGKHMLKTRVEQQQISTTRNGHFYMRENAIQAIIRRHQKLSGRLDSPTDDCDIAPVSFLNLSKQINTLWPGHLFLKCFSWLPFSPKASWRPATSHDDICRYSKRGERAIYIVQRTLSFTYLIWLFLSKWYHWFCKDWFSMLSWSWRGRFWDGSLSSHRWNVYLAHLHFRSSVVGQMLL